MPGSEKSNKVPGHSQPGRDWVINQEIGASLRYAGLIQQALMPSEQLLQRLLGEHFILFMPKEVVSSDFYWVTQKDRQTYIVAADCTGHGVPGALMSILGISFLNEIVKSGSSDPAGRILNRLREKIMEALHQTGEFDESRDGMDLALCIINHDRTNMQFAGANNQFGGPADKETEKIIKESKLLIIDIERLEKNGVYLDNEISRIAKKQAKLVRLLKRSSDPGKQAMVKKEAEEAESEYNEALAR